MDQSKGFHTQTLDTFLAILILWTLFSNVYLNVVYPFLDNSSIESAFSMVNSILAYPLFFMNNFLDDLFLVLFGAKFYIQLKRYYKSITATWIFILVLFLDNIFTFVPYYTFYLLFTIPQRSVNAAYICLTLSYLGNFLPFKDTATYSFTWLPAMLFQCQIIMTCIYYFSAKQETSLVNWIFVLMLSSFGLYFSNSIVCYFALRTDLNIFAPVVFHNPFCAFHVFALGFLVCYMTDTSRGSYLTLNHHGKTDTQHMSKTVQQQQVLSVPMQASTIQELNRPESVDKSDSEPSGHIVTRINSVVLPQDVISSLQRLENTPLRHAHSFRPSVELQHTQRLPDDLDDNLSMEQPGSKKRLFMCCSKKKPQIEDSPPQNQKHKHKRKHKLIRQSSATGALLLPSPDGTTRYIVTPKHRQCCRLLREKVNKDEKKWISTMLYSKMSRNKITGEIFALMSIPTIYACLGAMRSPSGILYKQIVDVTTQHVVSQPSFKHFIVLLTLRTALPIMLCISLYYILIRSTTILSWLMQRVFLAWIGKSALPILYSQSISIALITSNTGSIKIGPYSRSVFFLYLIGGMCVCILLGSILNVLMEEPVQAIMKKTWLSFERYKASLVAKQYRRKLNGEL